MKCGVLGSRCRVRTCSCSGVLVARYSHFRNISPNLSPKATGKDNLLHRPDANHRPCNFTFSFSRDQYTTVGPSSKHPLREH